MSVDTDGICTGSDSEAGREPKSSWAHMMLTSIRKRSRESRAAIAANGASAASAAPQEHWQDLAVGPPVVLGPGLGTADSGPLTDAGTDPAPGPRPSRQPRLRADAAFVASGEHLQAQAAQEPRPQHQRQPRASD